MFRFLKRKIISNKKKSKIINEIGLFYQVNSFFSGNLKIKFQKIFLLNYIETNFIWKKNSVTKVSINMPNNNHIIVNNFINLNRPYKKCT